jgi:hypothetical protein
VRIFSGLVAGGCDVFCLKVIASWSWKILASHAGLDTSRTLKEEIDVMKNQR